MNFIFILNIIIFIAIAVIGGYCIGVSFERQRSFKKGLDTGFILCKKLYGLEEKPKCESENS
jgi:hypothetical protein